MSIAPQKDGYSDYKQSLRWNTIAMLEREYFLQIR